METKENIQILLNNMSTIDKATLVNLLLKTRYSGTPVEGGAINKVIEGYSKENSMIIDSFLWSMYGLHYKDYIEVIGPFIGVDVFKLDKKLDNLAIYHLTELGKVA